MREDGADAGGWAVVDHACRFCGGRVMRGSAGGFKCHSCGAETLAGKVRDICGCGLSAGGGRHPFRCEVNRHRSAQNPAVVVIVRGDQPPTPVPAAAQPSPNRARFA